MAMGVWVRIVKDRILGIFSNGNLIDLTYLDILQNRFQNLPEDIGIPRHPLE